MKIYWKKLIWVYVFRHLYRLIHYRKSEYWKVNHGCRDWIWNSKQWAECEKSMASFLPKLDDVIRKATAKDNHIITSISTATDQKIYYSGKVVAINKTT